MVSSHAEGGSEGGGGEGEGVLGNIFGQGSLDGHKTKMEPWIKWLDKGKEQQQ